jgi:hypothetical protein
MYLNLTVTTSENGIHCYKNLQLMQDPDFFNAISTELVPMQGRASIKKYRMQLQLVANIRKIDRF